MKKKFLLLFFLSCSAFLFSQKTDKKLQEIIKEAIQEFNGDIGIYVPAKQLL
jgi:hypothetical protein